MKITRRKKTEKEIQKGKIKARMIKKKKDWKINRRNKNWETEIEGEGKKERLNKE